MDDDGDDDYYNGDDGDGDGGGDGDGDGDDLTWQEESLVSCASDYYTKCPLSKGRAPITQCVSHTPKKDSRYTASIGTL